MHLHVKLSAPRVCVTCFQTDFESPHSRRHLERLLSDDYRSRGANVSRGYIKIQLTKHQIWSRISSGDHRFKSPLTGKCVILTAAVCQVAQRRVCNLQGVQSPTVRLHKLMCVRHLLLMYRSTSNFI